MDSGSCETWVERFYYDGEEQRCKPFVYGGCEGNSNNYGTMEECLKACKHGEADRVPPITPTPSAGKS